MKTLKSTLLTGLENELLSQAFGNERTENQNLTELFAVVSENGKYTLKNGTKLSRSLQSIFVARVYNSMCLAVLEELGISDEKAVAKDTTAKGLLEGINASVNVYFERAKRMQEIAESHTNRIKELEGTIDMLLSAGCTAKDKSIIVLRDKIAQHTKELKELQEKGVK